MTGKAHVLSGFLIGAALCAKYHWAAPHMLSCMIGSILPDADHPKSMVGKFVPLWLVCRPHRKNITHSLMGAGIATLIWLWAATSWVHALMFAVGYIVHLLLDTLTKMGVPWLWPKKTMFSLTDITHGIRELIVLFLFYTMVIAMMSIL